MKNRILELTFSGLLLMSLFAVVAITGCSEDDDMPEPSGNPVASFQYEISMDNFLEVSFQNFSQNATSYAWDFGDGNTSTEEEPTHTYSSGGSYTVTLTATNDDGVSADRSEDINIADPNEQLTLLAGTDSKTWYLQREEIAVALGPDIGSAEWFALGRPEWPLGSRPCVLDDSYTFHRDGTFEFNSNNTLFVDSEANGGWLGPNEPEGCHDEDEPGIFTTPDGTDISAFGNGGSYTYEFSTDENTLTLLGEGAYIGLANKTAGGDNFIPQSVKEFTVFNFADGDVADSLAIAIQGDGFVWSFFLVSYENPADLPDVPVDTPFGEDLDDITPDELSNTFESASSFVLLDTIVPSGSTLVYGVDDPADANAPKVGQFNRTDAQFQEMKFQTKPKRDINFANMTTVTLDVYLPSTNDYSGSLTKAVIIGIADQSATANWWEDHYEFVNDGSALPTDEWVTLTYQLDSNNAGSGSGTVHDRNDLDMIYINIGGTDHFDTGTYYIRNFRFE